jgi:hypothetical protein
MSRERVSSLIALISAVVAVVVTVYGIYERRREVDAERRQQQVTVKKDFLLEQYRYRIDSYADVLKALGTVSDVLDPGPRSLSGPA